MNLVDTSGWIEFFFGGKNASQFVDPIEDIALRAALISLRHKLPMADSFIYATGQLNEALIWTQDAHFEGLPGVKYIEARTTG